MHFNWARQPPCRLEQGLLEQGLELCSGVLPAARLASCGPEQAHPQDVMFSASPSSHDGSAYHTTMAVQASLGLQYSCHCFDCFRAHMWVVPVQGFTSAILRRLVPWQLT